MLQAMGYALSGFVDFFVEVRWIQDDPQTGLQVIALLARDLGPEVTVMPVSLGTEPLGAMVEGIHEHRHWLRVTCEVGSLEYVMGEIRKRCEEGFARAH